MPKIDPETIKHIAKLSRVSLSDIEVAKYSRELSSILAYVEQLSEVETKGIEPLIQVSGLKNVFREDEVTNTEMTEELLANSPMRDSNFLKVKAVKE